MRGDTKRYFREKEIFLPNKPMMRFTKKKANQDHNEITFHIHSISRK